MSDYDYLETGMEQSEAMLTDIAAVGNKLKELKLRMLETQAAADHAAKEYKHYAEVIIPMQMKSIGLDSIKLASGGTLSVVHNVYCQPNKNEKDKKIIADWLASLNGEHLIKKEATVSQDSLGALDANGIPYAVATNVNTNSLKAFIKNALGLSKGSTKQIDIEDIPACIHFSMVDTVEVTDD